MEIAQENKKETEGIPALHASKIRRSFGEISYINLVWRVNLRDDTGS